MVDWRAHSDRGAWLELMEPDKVDTTSFYASNPGLLQLIGCIVGWVDGLIERTEVTIPKALEEQIVILAKRPFELRDPSDTATGTAESIIDGEAQEVKIVEHWVASPNVCEGDAIVLVKSCPEDFFFLPMALVLRPREGSLAFPWQGSSAFMFVGLALPVTEVSENEQRIEFTLAANNECNDRMDLLLQHLVDIDIV